MPPMKAPINAKSQAVKLVSTSVPLADAASAAANSGLTSTGLATGGHLPSKLTRVLRPRGAGSPSAKPVRATTTSKLRGDSLRKGFSGVVAVHCPWVAASHEADHGLPGAISPVVSGNSSSALPRQSAGKPVTAH